LKKAIIYKNPEYPKL